MLCRGQNSKASIEDSGERIGLFALYSYCGISYSIVSTGELLGERGYGVDLFTSEQKIGKEFLPTCLRLLEVPDYGLLKLLNKPVLGIFRFAVWAATKCHGRKYKCFIGYDPPGLIAASVAGTLFEIPVMYHSLEIWSSEDLPKRWYRFKALPSPEIITKQCERHFHRKAILTIIQDKRRERVLFADNHLPARDVYYVPHVNRGSISIFKKRPDYFRRKFGIDHKKIIILMIGGINHTTLAYETGIAAGRWPVSYHLVLHGFGTAAYLEMVRKSVDPARVTISTDLVSMDELRVLVASADIGLALYPNSSTNMYEMTSGKIGQYFKVGIPVIANDFPNLIEVVEKSGAGVCINNLDEIPLAVNGILKDYEKFKEKAYEGYLKYYDFDRAFEPVLKRLIEF